MGKKLLIIILILLILGGAGFAAYYFLADNISLINRNIDSGNGMYSIRVPISWKDVTPESQDNVIEAQNASSSMYMQLSFKRPDMEDSSTIEDYVYSYINGIAANSDDPLVQVISVTPSQAVLGENTGYYFELDSMSDGLAIHLWDFVFAANGGYVHIDVAAAGADISEAAGIAKAIISSATVNAN